MKIGFQPGANDKWLFALPIPQGDSYKRFHAFHYSDDPVVLYAEMYDGFEATNVRHGECKACRPSHQNS